MKKICFCCSTKFYETLFEYMKKLDAAGIQYLTPNTEVTCKEDAVIDDAGQIKLAKDHQDKIDQSEAIYVINPGGYVGESVSAEIAYAKGAKKKVYLMGPVESPVIKAHIDEVISIDELIERCK